MSFFKGTNTITPWFNVRTDFGAVGNGSADDTAAINAAIAAANASAYGGIIYFPAGNYRVTTSCTTITKNGVSLKGDTVGVLPGNGTVITIDGNPNPASADTGIFKFEGNLARGRILSNSIQDITFRCNSTMTTGCVLNLDFTWDFTIDRVDMYNPYNAIYARQFNNIRFRNMRIADVRGSYGIKAYGSKEIRNSPVDNPLDPSVVFDRSDVLTLWHVIITSLRGQGVYPDLLWIDGFVHTTYLYEVRLLQAGRGIYCTNTPNVSDGEGPALMYTHDVEIEGMQYQCLALDHMYDAVFHALYAWGVYDTGVGYGIYLNQKCQRVYFTEGKVGDCALSGFALGSSTVTDIRISNFYSYNTQGSGIFINAGDNIAIQGGTAINNSRYGIENASGTRVNVNGVRLTNNSLGPISGPIATSSGLLESAAIARTATQGFTMIPIMTGSGTPGTPKFSSNTCPMVFNASNSRLYVRIGNSWRSALAI